MDRVLLGRAVVATLSLNFAPSRFRIYMSYSLNSLKVGYVGDHIGSTIGVIRGILGV